MHNELLPLRPISKTVRLLRGTAVAVMVMLTLYGSNMLLGSLVPVATPSLGACVRNETLFPAELDEQYDNIIDQWAADYHDRVNGIIEEHVAFLQNGGSCLRDDGAPPPEPKLGELMDELPGWSEKTAPSQEDVASALVDYLQEYECALQDRAATLEVSILNDMTDEKSSGSSSSAIDLDTAGVFVTDFEGEIETQDRDLREQMALARDTLHRVLLYLSGHARVWRLNHSLQCLEGAMVDIRNALSLVADASATLSRIWDAQTSIRTINEPQ